MHSVLYVQIGFLRGHDHPKSDPSGQWRARRSTCERTKNPVWPATASLEASSASSIFIHETDKNTLKSTRVVKKTGYILQGTHTHIHTHTYQELPKEPTSIFLLFYLHFYFGPFLLCSCAPRKLALDRQGM